MRRAPLLLLLLVALALPAPVRAEEPQLPDRLERISVEEAAATPGVFDAFDPLEPVNRRIYWFNAHFDRMLFLPAVRAYRFVLPELARTGITNFLDNLGEVTVFANSVLQLRPKKAAGTLGRFAVNSTVGVAGLWDPATRIGLPAHYGSFGQTLGRYRLGPGPYLVVPFLGPSTLRDGTGQIVDYVIAYQVNVLNVRQTIAEYPALFLLESVNTRANVPFRYGDLGTPFEYELVRFIWLARAELLATGP